MSNSKTVEKALRDLFREVFIEKCHLEEASMTTEEEDSINELEIYEVIENLRDIFTELITFKREFVKLDKSELIKRSEQFESMLQKLEAEVRNHIRVEHQLKLHIENNQAQNEELEIKNNQYLNQIKELNEKIKTNLKGFEKKESKDVFEKIGKLESQLLRKETIIKQLETEISKLRKNNEGVSKENNKARYGEKKNKYAEEFEEIKKNVEEKGADLLKIESIIKERSTPKPMKERNRSLRKSINDGEVIKHRQPEGKNNTKFNSRSHSRSTSDQVRPLSGLRRKV